MKRRSGRPSIRHSTFGIRHSTRHSPSPAFTLIELVLVLVIMSLMLALAAPTLRGWSRGSKLRDATDQLLAATEFARSGAAAQAMVHRIEFDMAAGAYRVTVQNGDQFEPASGEFGQMMVLPSGVRLDIARADGSTASAIDFHPTGRTTPARVTLLADWGESQSIAAATPAEPFRRVPAGEGS